MKQFFFHIASGALSLGGNGADDGDDSIVPSTPTLYVPRRNDGLVKPERNWEIFSMFVVVILK